METQTNQIVSGTIWRQMLLFFFPIFVGTMFQQLYSMIDAVILGRFVGKEALAAVGGSDMELIGLLVNFFVGLSSGASVLVSQHYGARRGDALQAAVCTGMALSVVCGAALTVAGVLIPRPILRAMNTPEDVLDYAVDYMRWYFAGMVPSMLYNMGSGVLRAVGDSRRPLYYLIVCCLFNVALDFLFVVLIPLATAGAAIATSIAQIVCAALVLRALLRTDGPYRLVLARENISRVQLRQMLKIGLPAGIQSSMYGIANVFLQAAINGLGTDAVAAWAAFRKIDSFYWPVSGAMGVTVTTFAGQNFGARRYDRLRKTVRTGLFLLLLATLFFSALACLARRPLLGLFNDDPAVLAIGERILLSVSPYYVLYFATEVLSGAMRGVGESLRPALFTLLGTCVLRLAYLFGYIRGGVTNEAVAFSYPMTWAVTTVLFLIYYFRGGWLRRRLPEGAVIPPRSR